MPVAAVPRVGRSSGKLDERGVSLKVGQMSKFEAIYRQNQSKLHLTVQSSLVCNGGDETRIVWGIANLSPLKHLGLRFKDIKTQDSLRSREVKQNSSGSLSLYWPRRFGKSPRGRQIHWMEKELLRLFAPLSLDRN